MSHFLVENKDHLFVKARAEYAPLSQLIEETPRLELLITWAKKTEIELLDLATELCKGTVVRPEVEAWYDYTKSGYDLAYEVTLWRNDTNIRLRMLMDFPNVRPEMFMPCVGSNSDALRNKLRGGGDQDCRRIILYSRQRLKRGLQLLLEER